MEWRGPAVLVALLAIGAGGGYAASAQTRDTTIGAGVPAPVPAERAGDAASRRRVRPCPTRTTPRSRRTSPMMPTTARHGQVRDHLPRSRSAGRTNANASNEWKWKEPGTSNNSYVMRIEQIDSQDITIEDAIDIRIERLRAEQEDVVIVDRGADSLEYTYRSNEGNARHSFMRWLDLDASGQADVEIVVHGRERRRPGTSDLIRRVAEGMQGAAAGLSADRTATH